MELLSLWRIAVRNVMRNRRRTLITLAALVIGVGVMVSIRGVLNGLQTGLVRGVVTGQTGALQVHKAGYLKNVLASPLGLDMDEAAVKAKVMSVRGIKAVAPRINFGGMVNVGDETLFLLNQAVDPKAEFAVCNLRRQTVYDDGKFAGDKPGITAVADAMVVTTELDKALKGQAKKGTVQAALLAPDKDGALSGENVTLVGTMNLNAPGERKIGMVRLDVAQRLLKMEGRVTELIIAIDDLEQLNILRDELQKVLGPEYEVHTWEDIAKFVVDARNRQNIILQVVATVFMLLMMLGVANTMLMSVLDRTREIGTMMAVGVRRGKIVVLFLLEASVIGAMGGVLGAVVGKLTTLALYARGIEVKAPGSNVPFVVLPEVGLGYMAMVVAIASAGALVFSLYPAWRASRLRPVQALAGG